MWHQEDINCGHDEVPDNVTLHPIAIANKSLSSVEQWYNNIKWEALNLLHGLTNFTTTVLPWRYI